MEQKWEKSGLEIGTKLRIPAHILQESEKAKDRLKECTYIGETNAGIIVDLKFQPAWGSREPEMYHYRRHINWADIWRGAVKVRLEDGALIRVFRYKCTQK